MLCRDETAVTDCEFISLRMPRGPFSELTLQTAGQSHTCSRPAEPTPCRLLRHMCGFQRLHPVIPILANRGLHVALWTYTAGASRRHQTHVHASLSLLSTLQKRGPAACCLHHAASDSGESGTTAFKTLRASNNLRESEFLTGPKLRSCWRLWPLAPRQIPVTPKPRGCPSQVHRVQHSSLVSVRHVAAAVTVTCYQIANR